MVQVSLIDFLLSIVASFVNGERRIDRSQNNVVCVVFKGKTTMCISLSFQNDPKNIENKIDSLLTDSIENIDLVFH